MAHPSLRLFGICEAMKWNHLPVSGGLYAQHPDLLDDFALIFQVRAAHEEAERKKQEQEQKKQMGRTGSSRTRGPRRR
jgi:hypothetical protein